MTQAARCLVQLYSLKNYGGNMGLSKDLINQYVEAVVHVDKNETRDNYYGTIVEFNSTNYVKMDGSDVLTPITNTVSVNPGDRVMVRIQNRTATIASNLTSNAVNAATLDKINSILKTDILATTDQRLNSAKNDLEVSINSTRNDITLEMSRTYATAESFDRANSALRELKKWITTSAEQAIKIGSNSAITLSIDNDRGIIFENNGVEFGSWDGTDFHTGNIIIDVREKAQFGNFAWVPRSDGSLMLLKVKDV